MHIFTIQYKSVFSEQSDPSPSHKQRKKHKKKSINSSHTPQTDRQVANYYLKSDFLYCPVAMTVGKRSAFINIACDWSLNINNSSGEREVVASGAHSTHTRDPKRKLPARRCVYVIRDGRDQRVVRCNKLFRFNCELMTFGASVCLLRGVKVARDPARWAHLPLGKVLVSHLLLNDEADDENLRGWVPTLCFIAAEGQLKGYDEAQVLINEVIRRREYPRFSQS